MTKTTPQRNDNIYDADDNVLVRYMNGRHNEYLAVAKDTANKRGECVYYYADNGREVVQPDPVLGLGATISWVEDRAACTVIAVSPSGNKVTVRRDKAIRTDDNGMSQSQSYRFERDPHGAVDVFYRQGDGSYKAHGKRLTLGLRNAYHCYER
jgi:hypothetical protein